MYLLSRGDKCESSLKNKGKGISDLQSQMALVFFVEKKNSKKWIIQNYRYLNE